MDWFREGLDNIHWPYNLRGFYNRHKVPIFENEYCRMVLKKKIKELKKRFSVHALESESLDELDLDIDCDFEKYVHMKEVERERLKNQKFEIKAKVCDLEPHSKLQRLKEVELPSEGIVAIEVLRPAANLNKAVQRELIREGIKRCDTMTEFGKFLGVSVRTARNWLNEYVRELQYESNVQI